MPSGFHGRDCTMHGLRKLGLLHREIAPHIDDFWHLRNPDGTGLHASGASGTGPKRVRRKSGGGPNNWLVKIRSRVRETLKIQNNVAWRKQLADRVGRARGSATSAFGASIEIQKIFPAKAGKRCYSQCGVRFVKIERFERRAAWRKGHGI